MLCGRKTRECYGLTQTTASFTNVTMGQIVKRTSLLLEDIVCIYANNFHGKCSLNYLMSVCD